MQRQPKVTAALTYNLYLKSDLLRVARAFEASRIDWLVIKGVSLADTLYGGLAYRSMVDNDIVVRRHDVARAHVELRRLGFVDRESNVLALNLNADFQHPMHFEHADVYTGLELHWHIHPPELFRGDVEPYFQRAITLRTGDVEYRTLCADDRFVHLVTHWAQHGLNKPSILEDVARAWNLRTHTGAGAVQVVNPVVVARRAKRMGALPLVALALLLLREHGRLEVEVPQLLHHQRAQWFARLQREPLAHVVLRPLEGARAHRLRAASWLLLTPRSVWSSASRELAPSRARLSRIVGHELSRTQAVAALWTRQRRAVAKWMGTER